MFWATRIKAGRLEYRRQISPQKRKHLPSREVVTAVAGAVAEWLFAVVPLIVLSIVLSHLKHGGDVLESAEWSFGASVLAGQGVVRFVSGLVKAQHLSVDSFESSE